MARFIVTDSSYFQPFTYDELARPVQNMQTAHNAAQDVYDEIGTESSALARYISDKEGDRQAKALYDNYMDKLKTLQDNLWENGYTGRTRRDLSAARQGYASDIARLSAAIKARQERSADWAKRRNDNPNLVTAADPGLSGLDSYLADDNYGRSFWSYDSSQFEKEIGTEAKNRAGELLNNPRVVKDPRLKAILTRIYGTGFTNAEVNDAAVAARALIQAGTADGGITIPDQAARTAFYDSTGLDEPSRILVETLFNRYEATGAPTSGASIDELNRLLDRGIGGFSYGIGSPVLNDFTDPDFTLQQQDLIDYRNRSKALADNGGAGSDRTIQFYDTDSANKAGIGNRRRLDRQLGMKKDRGLMTKDGRHMVNTGPEAASLVYSDDLARDTVRRIGFDFRRSNANPNNTSGILHGSDGRLYQTTYMPDALGGKGGVAIRPYDEGTAGIPWRQSVKSGDAVIDARLTDIYNEAMRKYSENLDYYKENEPEIYRLAKKIDPDEQVKRYEKYGFDAATPLSGFVASMTGDPEYQKVNPRDEGWIARRGSDKGGYADMLTDMLSNTVNLKAGKDNRLEKHREWKKAGKDNSFYIHRLNEYSNPERKGVKDPNGIYRVKAGKITNINGYRLDADGILNHYLIASTDDSSTDHIISTSMLKDAGIEAILDEEGNGTKDNPGTLRIIMENPNLSTEERNREIHDEVEYTIRRILDYLDSSVSKSSSGTMGAKDSYMPMPSSAADDYYYDYSGIGDGYAGAGE